MTGQLRRHVRRHHSARVVMLWLAAMGALSVLALAEELVSHVAVFVPAASAAVIGAFWLGRRRALGTARRQAARRLEDAQRERLVAELESLANRSLDEIVGSYRVIARRNQGGRSAAQLLSACVADMDAKIRPSAAGPDGPLALSHADRLTVLGALSDAAEYRSNHPDDDGRRPIAAYRALSRSLGDDR